MSYVRFSTGFIDNGLRELTGTEYKVLSVLTRFRNSNTGLCCPSEERIAQTCGVSARQVMRAIKGLKDKRAIEIKKLRNNKDGSVYNSYIFNPK